MGGDSSSVTPGSHHSAGGGSLDHLMMAVSQGGPNGINFHLNQTSVIGEFSGVSIFVAELLTRLHNL